MPTIYDFIRGFGWTEFWIVLAVTALIVFIRERHHFIRKTPPPSSGAPSAE
jgi:hypothetical protein